MTSNIINFIREDRIIEIKNPDPNETLLNYIRTKLKKTGTKEGCAEGGCGACTVVLGELKNNEINYKAVNSCISLLPTLQGKQLILVEDLISKEGSLHPVQQAMVNYHGSQCGFCTPGFIMSLFSMFKKNSKFKEDEIKESISGNLCRCTGYQPIIKAAKSLKNKNKTDHFSKNKKNIINLLKKKEIIQSFIWNYNLNKIDQNNPAGLEPRRSLPGPSPREAAGPRDRVSHGCRTPCIPHR